MNNPYFEEKAEQISESTCTAFGMELFSRHSKAYEMGEMLLLSNELALNNLHPFVKELFYDSNSCCMSFKFHSPIDQFSPEAEAILKAGRKHISQFDWFGYLEHKDGLEDDDLPH